MARVKQPAHLIRGKPQELVLPRAIRWAVEPCREEDCDHSDPSRARVLVVLGRFSETTDDPTGAAALLTDLAQGRRLGRFPRETASTGQEQPTPASHRREETGPIEDDGVRREAIPARDPLRRNAERRRPHVSLPFFRARATAWIVFQLRVVTGTPKIFSSWPRKPIALISRRYSPRTNRSRQARIFKHHPLPSGRLSGTGDKGGRRLARTLTNRTMSGPA